MNDLTKGYPAKILVMFALPLMIGNIAQQLYNITDSKIVSLYVGGNALAAVGATAVISNLLIGFLNGLTQGFAIVTARCFGASNKKGVRRAVAGTVLLVSVFAAAFTVLGFVCAKPLLQLLHTPKTILPDALAYIRIIITGLVFSAIFNMCANTLRAVGDSKRPLYCIFGSIAVNVFLDVVFTKYLAMGIRGAAYATVISQALCAVLCMFLLFTKTKDIIPKRTELLLSQAEYRELMTFGLAMAFMGCLVNIGTVILQSGINGLGTTVMTAHVAARKILDILMILVYTLGFAMTTYVSQNYGAGRIDRIRQGVTHAIVIDSGITTVLIAFTFLFGRDLVCWVASSGDSVIAKNGELYLKIGVICFYALGPLFIFRCSLQGMGAKVVPLLTSTMELCIKLLSVLFLVPKLKYLGIALTEPISWIAMMTVLAVGYGVTIRKKMNRRGGNVE